MFDVCSKSEDNLYGGIMSMFAFVHLTPGRQLDLFQHIWRMLIKDGLFMIASSKDPLPSVKTTFENDKSRVGVI